MFDLKVCRSALRKVNFALTSLEYIERDRTIVNLTYNELLTVVRLLRNKINELENENET